MLQQLETEIPLDLAIVDISEDATLMDRYGIRIPVLQGADGRELNWPFDLQAVREFFAD